MENPIVVVESNNAKTIQNLFREVSENMQDSFEKIIEIGRLLIEEKENNKGTFTQWIEKSDLGFGIRQAQKYMKIYESGTLPKSELGFASLTINEMASGTKDGKEPKKPSKRQRIEKLQKEIDSLETKLKTKKAELKDLIGDRNGK